MPGYRCPACGNATAGKEMGGGRLTGECLSVLPVSFRPPVQHPDLGLRESVTIETWRLSCPCGHVWETTRER